MKMAKEKVVLGWSSRVTGFTILVAMLALFGVGSIAVPSSGDSRNDVKPEFTTFKPKNLPVNWEEIPASNIRLFYPGQGSWDWLISPQKDFSHPGAPVIKAGVACRTCHKIGGGLESFGRW